MRKIEVKRPLHIIDLLKRTRAEFKRRGLDITTDQVHCLQSLMHWTSLDIEETVNQMIKYYVIILD